MNQSFKMPVYINQDVTNFHNTSISKENTQIKKNNQISWCIEGVDYMELDKYFQNHEEFTFDDVFMNQFLN